MSVEVYIAGGLGGVGKTTVSAAMGVGLAMAGKRVVVLTIDPARRLADALCLDRLGNNPQRVPLDDCPGSLDALMLDRKATWDEVVQRYSSSPDRAGALLKNTYYRAVSTRLTGSHEYMAIEKLFDLVDSGRWDVVVVDTPPSQHALEFFRAPARVRALLEGRVMRAVVDGRSGGFFGGATRRVAKLVLRLAGQNVIEDLSEFFTLFSDISEGFRERSQHVMTLLHSDATRLYLITSASAPDRADALEFLEDVRERQMRFAGFIINRVQAPVRLSRPLTKALLPPCPDGLPAEHWDALTTALLQLPATANADADRHAAAIDRMVASAGGAPAWAVPERPSGVRSLEGLVRLSQHLPPASEGHR